MRTAPEGLWFIIGAWLVALGLILTALRLDSRVLWIACVCWVILAVWVIAFFRDPERSGERGDRLILSPADGKVVSIVETEEPAFLAGRSCRVSIFMNVFDVHVNRYPTEGTVAFRHYNPGKFGHAGSEKSSLDNEQSSVGLTTSRGKVLIRQIAGLIARRIVTDHSVGTPVKQGQRLGIIRFGSRVDLFLPCDRVRFLVKPGDTAKAGLTVVAEWI
jgi:phosphatidylserine decarboxylase